MYDLTPLQWDTSTDDTVLDKILSTICRRKNELEAIKPSQPFPGPGDGRMLSASAFACARHEYRHAMEKWALLGHYTKVICGAEAFHNLYGLGLLADSLSSEGRHLLEHGRRYGEFRMYGDLFTFELRHLPGEHNKIVTLL